MPCSCMNPQQLARTGSRVIRSSVSVSLASRIWRFQLRSSSITRVHRWQGGRRVSSDMAAPSSAAPALGVAKDVLTADQAGWTLLGTPPVELQLDFTLPTGQSFRWQRTGDGEFTGVIGQRVVRLRQLEGDVEYRVLARGPSACTAGDAVALHDYFNLSTSLAKLAREWAAADARFAHVHPSFLGARMLRQDPVECLFQFVCSSNNHISRIKGMVDRLCRRYGTPLPLHDNGASSSGGGGLAAAAGAGIGSHPAAAEQQQGEEAGAAEAEEQGCYYAFPTLDQLAEASEEALREDGFGYRAKFITGSVAALREKPGGGEAWLLSLRDAPYEQAAAELEALPGIGPKVAACICLFSLDKHDAIPVDTHVWALATRYYAPHLKGKSLTKKVHAQVQAAFVDRFGPYAGWAHNTLFISELASMKDRLPPPAARAAAAEAAAASGMAPGAEGGVAGGAKPGRRRGKAKAAGGLRAAEAEVGVQEEGSCDEGPAVEVGGGVKRRRGAGGAAAGLERWRQRKAGPEGLVV